MKGSIILALAVILSGNVTAQNFITGPTGVYGPQHNAATAIGKGGSVLVGTGGTWMLGGNITSADKGGSNKPTAAGRAETISFDSTGTYSGAATKTTGTGFVIDGYAVSSHKSGAFVLPIGDSAMAYPVTIPAGSTVTAAYFKGRGADQIATIYGARDSVYSQYLDFPAGFSAGVYKLSYPVGFDTKAQALIVSSSNTSAGGTGPKTVYTFLTNSPAFGASGRSVSLTLPAVAPTQLYFATAKPAPKKTAVTEPAKPLVLNKEGLVSKDRRLSQLSVSVSPNPTRDMLTVQGLVPGSFVSLYQMSGIRLIGFVSKGATQQVSLNSYMAGIYLLRIQSPKGVVNTFNIIKN